MAHLRANKQLFDQWQFLSLKVAALAAIVQNDSLAYHNEAIVCWIRAWQDDLYVVEEILSKLGEETLRYLNELAKE